MFRNAPQRAGGVGDAIGFVKFLVTGCDAEAIGGACDD